MPQNCFSPEVEGCLKYLWIKNYDICRLLPSKNFELNSIIRVAVLIFSYFLSLVAYYILSFVLVQYIT